MKSTDMIGRHDATSVDTSATHCTTDLITGTTIHVHKKRDGLLLIDGTGRARYATLMERLLYRWTNSVPTTL